MSTTNYQNIMVPESTHALDNLSTRSIVDFRRDSLTRKPTKYAARSQRDGKVDSVGHIGHQLSTDDVVGHVLTIDSVCRAIVPLFDKSNNPIWETDENGALKTDADGNFVQATSIYPIVTFAEAPGYWYNGGTLLAGVLPGWAEEAGDEPDSMTYPLLNADLAEIGGIPCYFEWKQGRAGNKYVNMILA